MPAGAWVTTQFFDTQGHLQKNKAVSVVQAGTNTLAAITNRDGSTAANPTLPGTNLVLAVGQAGGIDSNGNFQCWAPVGDYDVMAGSQYLGSFTVPGGGVGIAMRPQTFIVAAQDANAVWKAAADYVCDGTADEVEINAALGRGNVALSDGDFVVGASVAHSASYRTLRGAGEWATTINRSASVPHLVMAGTGAAHVKGSRVADLGIHDAIPRSRPTASVQVHFADGIHFDRVGIDSIAHHALECVEVWDSDFDVDVTNSGGSAGAGIPAIGVYQSFGTTTSTDTCNNLRFWSPHIEGWFEGAFWVIGQAGHTNPYNITLVKPKIESYSVRGPGVKTDRADNVILDGGLVAPLGFDTGFSTRQYAIELHNGYESGIQGTMVSLGTNSVVKSVVQLDNMVRPHTRFGDTVGSTTDPLTALIDVTSTCWSVQPEGYEWDWNPGGKPILNGEANVNYYRSTRELDVSPDAGKWALVNLHGPSGQGSSLQFFDGTAAQWTMWRSFGDALFRVSDSVNNRDHVLFTPGGSDVAALTEFHSTTKVWGHLRTSVASISASAAITATTTLANATSGAITATLPALAVGLRCEVKKTDSSANAVTVVPTSGTIDGAANFRLGNQYDSVTVVCDGTNWWVV